MSDDKRWRLTGVWDDDAGEWRWGDLPRGSRGRLAVIEPDLAARLDRLVADADGAVPISFGSLVNTAVEALLDGAEATR